MSFPIGMIVLTLNLIDSDGYFFISKKNHISIERTLHEKDVLTLFKSKQILGFKIVSKRSNTKAYRLRIHKKKQVEKV